MSTPNGLPLCVSEVETGSVHGLTAARVHVLLALYVAATRGLPTLADAGYDGTDNHALEADNRTYNTLLRGLRSLGERSFVLRTE